MLEFYLRVAIYFFCFLLALIGMNALDFNRFIKQGKVVQAQILYFVICCALAYLMGNFLMALIYHFYKGSL
ncbi:MAG: DUF1146 domain-containing protein [Erysipelotrichaceae bacterium]|nr:DUF1146 domain-containing protein [Erysipelotrichaceae bacterium]